MKRIDMEAHFVTKDYVRALEENTGYPRYSVDGQGERRRLEYTDDVGEPLGDALLSKLLDTGSQRLESMDAAGIDVQALSLTSPGVEWFEPAKGTALARKCNDQLAEVIQKRPDRFVGFAALAPNDPESAVDELERAVEDLGFMGWKTHSNYGGTYLDEHQYWPILERVEHLDVPIYLHPAVPAIPPLRTYGFALAGAPFGFGIETSICVMRLVFSGVFDRYPRLRIILGHLGEGLPFLMQRIDFAYVRPWFDPDARPNLMKRPSDYLRENMFITTSGNYLPAAFMCAYEVLGIDRILLATDYPYEDANECVQFLDGLPITDEDREKLFFRNAGQFGIRRELLARVSANQTLQPLAGNDTVGP
jgi:predicted TIM-barrel fold metal-dependent hydrolase